MEPPASLDGAEGSDGQTGCTPGSAQDGALLGLCNALGTPSLLVPFFGRSREENAAVDFEAACGSTGGIKSPEERRSVHAALDQAFQERSVRCVSKGPAPLQARSSSDPSSWVPVALAVALPLLEGAIPLDEHGSCVMPHPHPLCEKKARARLRPNALGLIVYDTQRACDNCDEAIEDRIFYSCARGCKVDFCKKCHRKLKLLFENLDQERVKWITNFVGRVSTYVLQSMSAEERLKLAACLASDWPHAMFERLVVAIVGVADALVVHMEDNHPDIASNKEFWHIIGLLQVLYAANTLPVHSDGMSSPTAASGQRHTVAPRIEVLKFPIRGIDKCDARGEYHRWCDLGIDMSESTSQRALTTVNFEVTAVWASFLTHSNLVPISFRQRCLQHDVFMSSGEWGPFREDIFRERAPMHLRRAPRDSVALLHFVVRALGFHCARDQQARPVTVTFQGEPAEGPGVTQEFLCLAMRSLLDCGSMDAQCGAQHGISGARVGADLLWEYDPELRTYWFREPRLVPTNHDILHSSMRACGALLGHAVFSGCMLPAFFPQVLYTLLLRDICRGGNRLLTLADLASVSPAMARSLERLLEYEGDDFVELFCLDWPRSAELTSENRKDHVLDYVQWFFSERYASQLKPLSDGFSSVVGRSKLLQVGLVDAAQLEQIVCGMETPVEAKAIQAGATVKDWLASDAAYLELFWDVLHGLRPEDLRRFVVFVSACGRAPPRGWQDLSITIQRNGEGDDRLPTSFTCFNLFFLPRYSSKDVLQERLLLAITETEGFGLR